MTVHHMYIADYAAGVNTQLKDFQATHGRGRGTSGEYKQIVERVADLRSALEMAIATDEQHASGFWNELKAMGRHGFNYWTEKSRFDGEVDALVSAAENLMTYIEDIVNDYAVPKLDIPDELFDASGQWADVAEQTDGVRQAVPPLQHVDGWSGPAYSRYQQMADVQIEATREYGVMPKSLADLYRSAGELNQGVLSVVYEQVVLAVGESSRCYAPPSGQYYVNTAAVSVALQTCASQLPDLLNAGEESAEAMRAGIDDLKAKTDAIRAGWPHGAASSQPPASDGSASEQPSHPAEPVPEAPDEGVSGDGLER
ncbi:MAG: hypothetical protein GX596_02580 [Propionibacterium sp.]|nr:hypothetical protein [Propionibacterium sp.]